MQMTQVSIFSWGWKMRATVVRMKMMYPAFSWKGGRGSLFSLRASRPVAFTTGASGANFGARKMQYTITASSMGRRAFMGSVSATV